MVQKHEENFLVLASTNGEMELEGNSWRIFGTVYGCGVRSIIVNRLVMIEKRVGQKDMRIIISLFFDFCFVLVSLPYIFPGFGMCWIVY